MWYTTMFPNIGILQIGYVCKWKIDLFRAPSWLVGPMLSEETWYKQLHVLSTMVHTIFSMIAMMREQLGGVGIVDKHIYLPAQQTFLWWKLLFSTSFKSV